MSDNQPVRTTITVSFLHHARWGKSSATGGFEWERWLGDLRGYALNAKQGIDLAENHYERLTRHQFYVTRLATMLRRLPDMAEAIEPLTELKREIDLLIHHHKSDLLRPVAAPRTTPTNADQTFRMICVLVDFH